MKINRKTYYCLQSLVLYEITMQESEIKCRGFVLTGGKADILVNIVSAAVHNYTYVRVFCD